MTGAERAARVLAATEAVRAAAAGDEAPPRRIDPEGVQAELRAQRRELEREAQRLARLPRSITRPREQS